MGDIMFIGNVYNYYKLSKRKKNLKQSLINKYGMEKGTIVYINIMKHYKKNKKIKKQSKSAPLRPR